MRSFLGVPIVAAEGVIGAFYLTEKLEAPDFSDEDDDLIELLAAHAAIAITNARLQEQARELSVVAERNRLALDLHDAVSQKLFGLVLSAEAAGTLLDRDPAAAREQVERLQTLAQDALDELRSLVFELRPLDLALDGLARGAPQARRARAPSRRARDRARRSRTSRRQTRRETSRCSASPRRRSRTRSSTPTRATSPSCSAARAAVCCSRSKTTASASIRRAEGIRSRRLGLTSMEERAERIGGTPRDPLRRGRRHDRAPGGTGCLSRSAFSIVDDHAVVREGLRAFLELQDGIEVVGEAADGNEAVGAGGAPGART